MLCLQQLVTAWLLLGGCLLASLIASTPMVTHTLLLATIYTMQLCPHSNLKSVLLPHPAHTSSRQQPPRDSQVAASGHQAGRGGCLLAALIENLWAIINECVNLLNPSSQGARHMFIFGKWKSISPKICQNLILGMCDCLHSCIAKWGQVC